MSPCCPFARLRRHLRFLAGAARLTDLERHEVLLSLGLQARQQRFDVERQADIRTAADLLRTGRRQSTSPLIFQHDSRIDIEVGAH